MTSATQARGCVGCTCRSPKSISGDRVLFATTVGHIVTSLRSVLTDAGAQVIQRGPGLLEARPTEPHAIATLLADARDGLTTVEAQEVRVLVMTDEDGDNLLAAALCAPTLGQSSARADHAHLLQLFNDEQNAFYSVYQPIVSLAALECPVIGYEALLRACGANGPLFPDSLFASAAASGWLHVLDRVGRTTALRDAEGWLGNAQLFVNFVPTTIYRPEVCLRTTEQAADRAGLRLDQLTFEVTETEHFADIAHLRRVFDYYRERGCRVAIDDLGSGFSSLNRLVELQPDVVKLDKELVQGLPTPVSAAVIAAIVQMTHSYGGLVLAECVETEEQAVAAKELGVDLGQGWYFGRPQPKAEPLIVAS